MADKVVWMTVTRRYDATSSGVDKPVKLLGVHTRDGESVKQMSAKVRKLLTLEDQGFVLQLRNSNKSLIPLNGKLQKNTKESPYSLDVVRQHQTLRAQPRSVRKESFNCTMMNQTGIILSRISNLENSLPELKIKRDRKIKQEIQQIEDKLNFLQKRFDTADQSQWRGLIKKSPLW